MTQEMVVFLARHSLIIGLTVVGPVLLADFVVGLAVAIFQAVTSIREMTITMIPKILAVVTVLILLLPWMLKVMVAYTSDMIQWMRVFGA